MQQDILPSTKRVVESARYVTIDKGAIETFRRSFAPKTLDSGGLGNHLEEWDIEKSIQLACLFNCINFCFWVGKGKPKWEVKVRGKTLDGSSALFRVLEEAIVRGLPLFDTQFLAGLDRGKLGEILKGNVEIPLLDERVKNLQEAGQILQQHFKGNFINVFEAANGDAIELTNLFIQFIQFFPSFDDYAIVDGVKVEFHKRAQLNTDMINYRLVKKGQQGLKNSDRLTAFADYKVPQVLRKFGILGYAPQLAEKVDSYTEIKVGSREEVEIRASTVWAIEEMKSALMPNYPDITAKQLDDYLWNLGQQKSPDDKPYHRTRTIFY